MALIACPECSRQVSTMAASCPQCGSPIATMAQCGSPRPVTIEQTTKSIKLGIVICAGLFWIGIIGFFGANNDQSRSGCGVMVGIGAAGYLIMKFARWWQNG